MLAAGCGGRNVYRGKVTGANFSACLDVVAPGDIVTVTRIDRLARSTFDLFAIVKQIVDGKAQFRSLAERWADPRHSPSAQQKEATRRRAQGATLDELARSYNVGISTIRRATAASAD